MDVTRKKSQLCATQTREEVLSWNALLGKLGENLVLRFEILIVKVPLFSLHGIQFKKVSGGMWQLNTV
jgi:hypothetical protein